MRDSPSASLWLNRLRSPPTRTNVTDANIWADFFFDASLTSSLGIILLYMIEQSLSCDLDPLINSPP